jgi:Animal haem peroxidase
VCARSSSTGRGLEMRYHGAAEIRGIDCPRSRYYDSGRFGRLFPSLPPLNADRESLAALGAAGGLMDPNDQPRPAPPSAENPDNPVKLPAGFTFLGQFIDHDITFDPTSSLERQVDPEAVSNFRTPTLELDNVYGAGPGASPHLYQRGDSAKLLIGLDTAGNPNDLPRNPEDVALVGDPRNDENLIVSQLHCAFLRFHNKVVAHVADTTPLAGAELFRRAQRMVRWHYQWVVVHDFLERIAGRPLVNQLMPAGATADEVRGNLEFYQWQQRPFIPVEFSVAAYRFGHSMIRFEYEFNDVVPITPIFSDSRDPLANLNGFRRLPDQWGFLFDRFFEMGQRDPQKARKIDSRLARPLGTLPRSVARTQRSLAVRNLLRGRAFGLPSGQDVARRMSITPLTDAQLGIGNVSAEFAGKAPLWFYILKEAERGGGRRLGPVGARIVAEVLIGLLAGDPQSFLRQEPGFRPQAPFTRRGRFGMAELIRFAFS